MNDKESDLTQYRRVRKLLDYALYLTEYSSHKQQKHSAVIFKHRRVISSACNEGIKTHPKAACTHNKKIDKLHAEIGALRLAGLTSVIGASMIVARERGRYSKPCSDCMEKIRESGIKQVIYSDGEGGFQVERI